MYGFNAKGKRFLCASSSIEYPIQAKKKRVCPTLCHQSLIQESRATILILKPFTPKTARMRLCLPFHILYYISTTPYMESLFLLSLHAQLVFLFLITVKIYYIMFNLIAENFRNISFEISYNNQ